MDTGKRHHIGVIFSSFDNSLQYEFWKGIVEYATENDISLTAYLGSYQSADKDYSSHFDTCFENIRNNPSLDGVIMFSGVVAQNIGQIPSVLIETVAVSENEAAAKPDFIKIGRDSTELIFDMILGKTAEPVIRINLDKNNVPESTIKTSNAKLQRICRNIVLSFRIDSLADELQISLPEFGIKTAIIGLYRSPIKSSLPGANRNIDTFCGFDGDKIFNINHNICINGLLAFTTYDFIKYTHLVSSSIISLINIM